MEGGLIPDKLTQFLIAHADEDAATLAQSLRGAFDIREKVPAARPDTAAIAVGQTWRNRSTDRLVRVSQLPGAKRINKFTGRPFWFWDDRVHWEALTGRGPTSGAVYQHGWTRKFDYVEG